MHLPGSYCWLEKKVSAYCTSISVVFNMLRNLTVPSIMLGQKQKTQALSKARTIWSKAAPRSKEAAHATKVLDEILAHVSHSAPNGASGVASAGTTTSSFSRDIARSAEPEGPLPLPQPNWSAVNSNPPSGKAPSKSYSVEWSYEWLDNLGKSKDHAPDGALGSLLTNGVDWVSFCQVSSTFTRC